MQKRKIKNEQLREDSRDLSRNNRSTKKKEKKNIAIFRNNDSLNGATVESGQYHSKDEQAHSSQEKSSFEKPLDFFIK